MLIRLVLVIREKRLEREIREHFRQPDIRIDSLGNQRNPFERSLKTSGDIFILSSSMIPEPLESSIALINDLPETPTTVILHDSESPEDHANLIAMGADVVLFQGLHESTLIEAVETTVDSRRSLAGRPIMTGRLLSKVKTSEIFDYSPTMRMMMETVDRVVASSSPILILGETGVGKEHLARYIHAEGQRASAPFVAVNCAALPEQLIESELFGHEEGAFTGAVRQRRGAFELAHGGTILLDEIGELPMHMQAKLLRVLQEYEVRPVGSERSIYVDVRVIATTNREIEREIESGRFRSDLYYRLSVLSLTVPALRDRREDIPAFVHHFIERFRVRMNKGVDGIEQEALDALVEYQWPGNVRELINVVERAMILSHGERISINDLPQGVFLPDKRPISVAGMIEGLDTEWKGQTLHEVKRQIVEKVERAYLDMALSEAGGRVGKAAKRAGIHPRGLYDKMRRFGLRKEDYREPGRRD